MKFQPYQIIINTFKDSEFKDVYLLRYVVLQRVKLTKSILNSTKFYLNLLKTTKVNQILLDLTKSLLKSTEFHLNLLRIYQSLSSSN